MDDGWRFQFQVGTPNENREMEVSWNGGTPIADGLWKIHL